MPPIPRENLIAFADKHLQPYRIHGDELQTELCPICNGGERGDKWTFSLNIENCTANCKRGSCGWKGTFPQLARYFGEQVQAERSSFQAAKVAKHYDLPNPGDYTEPSEEIYDYFQRRSISKATVDAFGIRKDADGNIVFPFTRDGALIFVKFRAPNFHKTKRKEWQLKNTCPILFGMDMAKPKQPLTVTEGEVDAMSLYEAGIRNVLSVPSGCDNFEWVETCWDWLEKFDEIILFGDNDEPGRKMVQTLLKRLGEYRCRVVSDYPINPEKGTECKDANEILVRCGDLSLIDMVENAKAIPLRGLINLADVHSIDPTTVERIKTGIPELDSIVGGLRLGSLTVLTGKPGEGKSTLVGLLALNAVAENNSACIYSGELEKGELQNWIDLQAAGSDYCTLKKDPVKNKMVPVVPLDVQNRIHEWYNAKIWLFDSTEVFEKSESEAILDVFQMAARRYGCKIFIVDNLMTSLSDADEETKAQSRFANALKRFALRYNVAVVLVAHPRKTKFGEKLQMDDVGGASATIRLAHTALSIEKPDIRIIKARDSGLLGNIACCYSGDCRRIYSCRDGDVYDFPWDKTGIAPPTVRADSLPEYGVMMKAPEPF
jgi:twinkle protein